MTEIARQYTVCTWVLLTSELLITSELEDIKSISFSFKLSGSTITGVYSIRSTVCLLILCLAHDLII